MKKLFVMYKLRSNVTLEQYADWSRHVDQQTTPRQPGCIRFEVYAIEGADGEEVPYQIVEDIEVDSWEVWQDTLKSEGMRIINEEFPKYADTDTVHLIYGKRIV